MECSNGNRYRILFDKSWLNSIGQKLLAESTEKDDLSRHIAQCYYEDCQTFWFVGGEFLTNTLIPDESIRRVLKEAVVFLNQLEPVTPEEILAAKGLMSISHGPCRLCLRERKLEEFRRIQLRSNYPPCFGTKKTGEKCDWEICIEDRRWDCSHPCTIHPIRELIRNERRELLSKYYSEKPKAN